MPFIAVSIIAVLFLTFIYASIRILREYERGVVFTLGRYTGTKGPGLFLLVPFVQQMVRVDLRVVVDEVPPQDVISRTMSRSRSAPSSISGSSTPSAPLSRSAIISRRLASSPRPLCAGFWESTT